MPSVYKCLKGFQDAGHQVSAIFPTNDRSLGTELDYEGMRFHLVRIPLIPYQEKFSHLTGVHGVSYRLAFMGKFWSACFYLIFLMRASLRAMRICMRERVDLLYGLSSVGAAPAALVGRLLRKPVVIRIFGTFIYPFKRIEWRWVKELPELVQFWLPREIMVMTNDGTCGDQTALGLGAPPERLYFWLNGLDKDYLQAPTDIARTREELGVGKDERVVVTVSRLADWKRVDRAINAFAIAAREVENARMVVVGEGEDREKLEALAASKGLGDRIRFVGSKVRLQIAPYYHVADVMLYTATVSSLSNCVMEAMVCGTPVVVTDAGGVREVCHDGENAVVVPEDDIEGLARAVVDLLKDEPRRRRIGDNAREYAMRNIDTWEARVRREVRMVEELARRYYLHVRPRSPKQSLLPGIIWPEVHL